MDMKYSSIPLLLVVLMIGTALQTSLATPNCTPVDYPRFRDRISEDGVLTPVEVGYPGRFLATAYIFGCHGVITEWAAYTVHNGSHPVEFHVWRADVTLPNVYHLVGMNTFQDAEPDSSHLISFKVPAEEQVVVAPGDIAGMRTIELPGVSEGFQIQFDNGGSFLKYFSGDSSIPTPNTLDLNDNAIRVFTSGGADLVRSPVIRATVVDISSETTSTVSTNLETDSTSTLTSETTPPSETSLVVVVAIVAATLLLLAIFILIFTLVVCCFLYNRNKKVLNQPTLTMTRGSHDQENRPSASEPQLQQIMSNPAYVVCDGLDSNPAYNNNSQFINVSNPAYNISRDQTQTEPYYSVIRS